MLEWICTFSGFLTLAPRGSLMPAAGEKAWRSQPAYKLCTSSVAASWREPSKVSSHSDPDALLMHLQLEIKQNWATRGSMSVGGRSRGSRSLALSTLTQMCTCLMTRSQLWTPR